MSSQRVNYRLTEESVSIHCRRLVTSVQHRLKDGSLGIDFSVPGSWWGNSSSERLCSFLNSREGPVALTINEAAT